jgi:hypothetical protein
MQIKSKCISCTIFLVKGTQININVRYCLDCPASTPSMTYEYYKIRAYIYPKSYIYAKAPPQFFLFLKERGRVFFPAYIILGLESGTQQSYKDSNEHHSWTSASMPMPPPTSTFRHPLSHSGTEVLFFTYY